MTKKQLENLNFLTIEKVQGIFKRSLRTLRYGKSANATLSVATVKDVVECAVWSELKALYEAEAPEFARFAPPPLASRQANVQSVLPPWMAQAPQGAGAPPWASSATASTKDSHSPAMPRRKTTANLHAV